jgi:hypothetical protein
MLLPLELFSDSNSQDRKEFTSFLFDSGYYREAVPGYLHLYYSSESKQEKARFAHMAGKCYLENGDLKEAEYLFRSFLKDDLISDALDESFYIDFSRSLYFQKKFHEVPYELEDTDFFKDSIQLKELAAWSYINTGSWDKADTLFNEIDTSGNNQRITGIKYLLKNRPDFDQKSPVTAAILSALLPGAGHAYSDNWSSAIGAFTVNLIFGSLTAYSVCKKEWAYAAVFGVMEAGWYTGNIASAYQEAEIYNRNGENRFKLKLSASFPVDFQIKSR